MTMLVERMIELLIGCVTELKRMILIGGPSASKNRANAYNSLISLEQTLSQYL